jgi:hypothetical protein
MDRILLFHLSDLHFGSGFLGTSDPRVGLGGHEIGLCEPLQLALKEAPFEDFHITQEDKLVYFIGGDLTRSGSLHDFQLVFTALFSQLEWFKDLTGTVDAVELGLTLADTYSIPGNHDHWKGKPVQLYPYPIFPPAYHAGIFPDLMATTPWRQPIPSANGKFILELFGIDSSEGLRGQSTNFRARGKLSQEELHGVKNPAGGVVRKGLEQLLDDARSAEAADHVPRLRAVGCHHSFGNRNGLADAWPLDGNSITNLLQLCRKFKVHAVLTGHALLSQLAAKSAKQRLVCLGASVRLHSAARDGYAKHALHATAAAGFSRSRVNPCEGPAVLDRVEVSVWPQRYAALEVLSRSQ